MNVHPVVTAGQTAHAGTTPHNGLKPVATIWFVPTALQIVFYTQSPGWDGSYCSQGFQSLELKISHRMLLNISYQLLPA